MSFKIFLKKMMNSNQNKTFVVSAFSLFMIGKMSPKINVLKANNKVNWNEEKEKRKLSYDLNLKSNYF